MVPSQRREFMQRVYVVLHGTLGSYLRDVLHEGGEANVACLLAPRASAYLHVLFSYSYSYSCVCGG
jgi:hypothetical protein